MRTPGSCTAQISEESNASNFNFEGADVFDPSWLLAFNDDIPPRSNRNKSCRNLHENQVVFFVGPECLHFLFMLCLTALPADVVRN